MLVLEGYGYVDSKKILYKGQTYTVSMYFQRGEPGKKIVEKVFKENLKPLVDFVSLTASMQTEIPQYKIIFKLKVKEMTSERLITNIKLHLEKYEPDVTDLIGGEVKLKELPTAMQIATNIKMPGKVLKATATGVTKAIGLPSWLLNLGTLKYIAIAGVTVAGLIFLSPYFKTATKIAGLSGDEDNG